MTELVHKQALVERVWNKFTTHFPGSCLTILVEGDDLCEWKSSNTHVLSPKISMTYDFFHLNISRGFSKSLNITSYPSRINISTHTHTETHTHTNTQTQTHTQSHTSRRRVSLHGKGINYVSEMPNWVSVSICSFLLGLDWKLFICC